MAQQAGKAAPAVAIAGVLVAAPQAQHAISASANTVPAKAAPATAGQTTTGQTTTGTRATLDAYAAHTVAAHTVAAHTVAAHTVTAHTVTVATTAKARHAAIAKSRYYTVRSGDTLSGIAQQSYGKAADWEWLFHENDKTVSDPNLIYVGQKLYIPATAPADYTLTNYVPKHSDWVATPAAYTPKHAVSAPRTSDSDSDSTSTTTTTSSSTGAGGTTDTVAGDYSCSALEQLWDSAGGNTADSFMAAEIAMAESSGDPNAISPTDDYGLWQINASNGSLATLDPYENAKSAIILSDDGTNWDAWTTYTSGRYAGQCLQATTRTRFPA